MRVVRDVFSKEFERAIIDNAKQHHRVKSFFERTAPELVDRVELYKDEEPLFERFGVEEVFRSTLSRAGRPARRRLPDDRPRRGADGDRRQHRQLHRPRPRQPRGHDHEGQPSGGRGGRAPAAAARHRRHHRDRLHRHGVRAQPRPGPERAAQGARGGPHAHLRRRDLAARPGRDDAPERDRGRARDHDQALPDLRRRGCRALRGDDRDRRRAQAARPREGVEVGGVPGPGAPARRRDPDRRRRQAAPGARGGDRQALPLRGQRGDPARHLRDHAPRARARRSSSARCRSRRARRS